MRRYTLFRILLFILLPLQAQHSIPYLQKQGSATQLIVDQAPFLVLDGELGNSSAASVEDIERVFPKLRRMGLNTVLVPAYWDLTEPMEEIYDFTLTDKVIRQARENHLKVIFLWFGAWKNSMSCYAPLWLKENYEKYPRARTKTGKPLEIASAFSENVYQADSRAFTQWIQHIAATDKEEGTVIMIQIQNEIGMLEDARDYSEVANKFFESPVPGELTDYLKQNRKTLHPQMLEKWGANGYKTNGNWQEVFGEDLYTDELFMAWHYARYVERMAQVARSIHPLFIPELRLADNNGVRAFYVFGEHDAIGFSPFSIENGSDDVSAPLVQAYARLGELMPLLVKYQGRELMNGLLFDRENRERILERDALKINCRHFFTLPWDPRATDGSEWPEGGRNVAVCTSSERRPDPSGTPCAHPGG